MENATHIVEDGNGLLHPLVTLDSARDTETTRIRFSAYTLSMWRDFEQLLSPAATEVETSKVLIILQPINICTHAAV